MNRYFAVFLILLPPAGPLLAQIKTIPFEITTPRTKAVKSPYKTIDFLDSRRDTSSIGILQLDHNGMMTQLVLRSPVLPQLADLLTALATPSGDGQLLFQLKRLSFAEMSGARYCYLSVGLYAKTQDRYTKLATLDTTIVVNQPSRLENILSKEGNQLLDEFMTQSIQLSAPSGADTYSLAEVGRIDSIEKRQIPAYNTTTYAEGCYSNYAAFANQKPDVHADVVTKDDGTISSLNIHDMKWRYPKGDAHIFAVVYKGVPYLVTHFGYYALQKHDDDFYFTGELRLAATKGEKVVAQAAFGMVGAALVTDRATYQAVIDHRNGEYIHLLVISQPSGE